MENRNSRVVHVRIKDKILFMLYQTIQSDDDKEKMSPAAIISYVLNRLADNISADLNIQIDDNDASAWVDDLLGIVVQRKDSAPKDPLESAISNLVLGRDNSIHLSNSSLSQDDVPIEPEIKMRSNYEQNYEEPPPELSSNPPWVGQTSFSELKALSPKDAIIEIAVEDNNKKLERAIECVYSNIPRDLWGTEKASNLIKDIMPIIDRYFDIGIE